MNGRNKINDEEELLFLFVGNGSFIRLPFRTGTGSCPREGNSPSVAQ